MAVNDTLWVKTHESLREFMKTLTCKKCGAKLRNPKQFLNCGHFACSECVGLTTNCVQCKIPGETSDVYADNAMNDLIMNLNIIAKAVGYKEEKSSEFKFENPKPPSEVPDDCNQSVRRQSIRRTKKNNMLDDTNMSVCESVISRTSQRSRASESIPKNIDKKNKKGETALHIACRSNNIERVKRLLEAKANPNTKDNAGWTPLQEAASYEYVEICEMLLNAGAQPNMYGYDNRTALHEAVIADDIELASLLIKANATKKVFDSNGKKPIDYCKSEEMSELLQNLDDSTEKQEEESPEPHKTLNLDKTVDQSLLETKIVLYGSKNLKQRNRKLLTKMGNEKKGVRVVNHFSPSVTHVIVDTDETSNIAYSLDILFTVLHGKLLLNSDGLSILMESNNITPADLILFEVNPPQLDDSLTRSRENILLQRPKLFDNCFFYFAIKQHETIEYDAAMSIKKDDLMKLVAAGNGFVLTREPKPDDIQGSLSPFHVANKPEHALHKCTHYIIYVPENTQSNANRILYNMPKLKTLPLMWFIESIVRFELIDPVLMGLVEP